MSNRIFSKKYLIVPMGIVAVLSGCGGGGGGNTAGGITPTTIHVATDVNNQKALLAGNAASTNTYILDVRQSGVMTVGGGDPYTLTITSPTGLHAVPGSSCGGVMHYGSTCQLTVDVPAPTAHTLTAANGYRAEQLAITIDATNTVTGEAVHQTIPVSVVNDPLTEVVRIGTGTNIGGILANAYHTANISEEAPAAWTVVMAAFIYPFNVPLIHTYDSQVTNTPLAMETRCGNTLVYFVAQQKLNRALLAVNNDNVIVKYHPLIADGVTTGVAGNPRTLNGTLTLLETGQAPITHTTSANAHDSTWSGPENIDRLRELITQNTAPNNNTIISILDNLSGAPLIDAENVGATKVVTVHSLINDHFAANLVRNLLGGATLINIKNNLLRTGLANDREFWQALVEYQNQVAKACYIPS